MTVKSTSIFVTAIAAASLATAAFAGGHLPQEKRQMAMKEVGKNMGVVAKMAKGETAFDGAAAQAAFVAMRAAVDDYETLFPDGSETGNETEAAPAIFTDRTGFEAKVAEFKTALDKAAGVVPASVEEHQANVGMVGKNCGSCHETFRVKKQ